PVGGDADARETRPIAHVGNPRRRAPPREVRARPYLNWAMYFTPTISKVASQQNRRIGPQNVPVLSDSTYLWCAEDLGPIMRVVRPRALDDFLKKARIPFTAFQHPEAFTAQHQAALSHVPGRSLAKLVVCFVETEPILAVLPAHLRVDLELLRVLAGGAALRL